VPLKDNSTQRFRRCAIRPVALFGILAALGIVLSGCQKKAYVNTYDPAITRTPLPCLGLRVFPPDKEAEQSLRSLYAFSDNCPYTLELSTKSGIHCNSNANVPQKVTSNFPSAYLRMELRKGMRLLYSYYIDLTHKPKAEDIREGFERLREDLKLPEK